MLSRDVFSAGAATLLPPEHNELSMRTFTRRLVAGLSTTDCNFSSTKQSEHATLSFAGSIDGAIDGAIDGETQKS
jgi:hypothetical protein